MIGDGNHKRNLADGLRHHLGFTAGPDRVAAQRQPGPYVVRQMILLRIQYGLCRQMRACMLVRVKLRQVNMLRRKPERRALRLIARTHGAFAARFQDRPALAAAQATARHLDAADKHVDDFAHQVRIRPAPMIHGIAFGIDRYRPQGEAEAVKGYIAANPRMADELAGDAPHRRRRHGGESLLPLRAVGGETLAHHIKTGPASHSADKKIA